MLGSSIWAFTPAAFTRPRAVMSAFQRAVQACLARQQSRLLIDVRDVYGEVSIMDRFDFGERMAMLLMKHDLRIAFLCRADQVTAEGFLENVMRNRGARVRVETDESRLLEWLNASA